MKKCRQYESAAKKIKINIGAVQREVAAAANLHPAFLASARKNRCMPRVGEIFKRSKKRQFKEPWKRNRTFKTRLMWGILNLISLETSSKQTRLWRKQPKKTQENKYKHTAVKKQNTQNAKHKRHKRPNSSSPVFERQRLQLCSCVLPSGFAAVAADILM